MELHIAVTIGSTASALSEPTCAVGFGVSSLTTSTRPVLSSLVKSLQDMDL
jgi:hypothetical protein